jgi:hypothetical protein
MHDWLDTWTGLGLVVADMTHPRWDPQLTATLRATGARTFFLVGIAHAIVGGSAWEPTPWRGVQRAACGVGGAVPIIERGGTTAGARRHEAG